MFKDKSNKGQVKSMQNRIAAGTVINGDITSDGDLRIDGKVSGSVKTGAKVVLGPQGQIEGELYCHIADIEGKVAGELHIEELLNLKKTAEVEGKVFTGRLSVQPGARFNASCTMHGVEVKQLDADRYTATARNNRSSAQL